MLVLSSDQSVTLVKEGQKERMAVCRRDCTSRRRRVGSPRRVQPALNGIKRNQTTTVDWKSASKLAQPLIVPLLPSQLEPTFLDLDFGDVLQRTLMADAVRSWVFRLSYLVYSKAQDQKRD